MRERRQATPARDPAAGGRLEPATIQWSDRQHTLTLTVRDGQRHLTAQDQSGTSLFNGPIDTEEQRNALPSDVRLKLEKLEDLAGGEGEKGRR